MIAMVDFWRLNHIKNVMRVDYDTYHGREVEGKADASMFLGAMKTILDLPVPKRDEPVAVSGGNRYGKENENVIRKQVRELRAGSLRPVEQDEGDR